MLKRILAVFIAVLLLSSTFNISATAQLNGSNQIKEKQLNKYLVEAGYPEDLISKYNIEQKKKFYEDKLTYGGSQTVYSIFTEDIEIPVVQDSGSEFVLADENDNYKLEKLLQDGKKVDKILKENNKKRNSDGSVSISALANWTATLTSSTPVYQADGKRRVYLSYNWEWNYEPVYTLTDKMGFAWSDDWDAEIDTAYYWYQAYGNNYGAGSSWYTKNEYKYNEYSPATGLAVAYDIISGFNKNGINYVARSHEGQAGLYISRYGDGSGLYEQTSAVARYFHHQGAISGTVNFEKSPSLSITYSLNYDQSIDSATLWSWKK